MDTSLAEHHIGNPPTHFRNPWPSFKPHTGLGSIKARFRRDRNYVPVPKDVQKLVPVRKPTWGQDEPSHAVKLKATWIGHATWLLQFPPLRSEKGAISSSGLTVLSDPIFSKRTSPLSWVGPKRYNKLPCLLEELPKVHVVIISHNHYDHLDFVTIKALQKQFPDVHFLCPLGIKKRFLKAGVAEYHVTELDWWDQVLIKKSDGESTVFICTPAQHNSARSLFDHNRTLWSSWTIVEVPSTGPCEIKDGEIVVESFTGELSQTEFQGAGKRLFFSGDTGYRAVSTANPTPEEEASAPRCPAFKEIGDKFGPFDLALLPIGLCLPRDLMSSVHCAPIDSVCIHKDIRSRKSIGMHYGTFRGGISYQFEPVTEPPNQWRVECEKAGLKWGEEAGLCDIGETISVA